MDEPNSQQEEPEERTVTPAEVWEQLSPDIQARVCSLFARMAYKYALSQNGLLPEEMEVRDGIQSHES
jgi:predicted FMN-binding regulatory protein PaiB